MQKVAVIGLGVMGTGLAEGLISAGLHVIVQNRTYEKVLPLVEKGAIPAKSPAEAILNSDVAIIVLSNAAAVSQLLTSDEVKKALKGKMILNASTTTYDEVMKLSSLVAENGGILAEVTLMVGGEELKAKKGKFMIGCNPEHEKLYNNLLKNLGEEEKCCTRVGEVGDASKAEFPMVVNSLFTMLYVAYSAAATIKMKVPQDIATHIIAMGNPYASYMLPNMFSRDYSNVMASSNSFIDVAKASIKVAESLGMPTKIFKDALELFEAAKEQGNGDKDGSSIVEVLLGSIEKKM